MSDDFINPSDAGQENETVPIVGHDDEQAWVEALKAMDQTAWDSLLRNYGGDLRQIIASRLRKYNLSEQWIDDIEQEIWLTVVKKIELFEWQGKGQLYSWLSTMAHNHIRNLNRALKADNESFDEIDNNVEETGLTLDFFLYANGLFEDSAEKRAELRDAIAAIDGALSYLKPRDREIVIRRLVLQETPREIAAVYGMKASTVSVTLVRAKKAIRAQMNMPDFPSSH